MFMNQQLFQWSGQIFMNVAFGRFQRMLSFFTQRRTLNRVGHIAPSCSSKLLPVVFLFLLVYYLRKQLSFSKSEWFWAVSNLHIWAYLAILGIFGHMGIWAYVKKIWSSGVSPKKALRMQLRDVDLRSVGHSSQKLWPKTFFGIKMPCILHYNAKKITNSSKSLRFWKTQLFSQKTTSEM